MKKWLQNSINLLNRVIDSGNFSDRVYLEHPNITWRRKLYSLIFVFSECHITIGNRSFGASENTVYLINSADFYSTEESNADIVQINFIDSFFTLNYRNGRKTERLIAIPCGSDYLSEFFHTVFTDLTKLIVDPKSAECVDIQIKSVLTRLKLLINKGNYRRYSTREIAITATNYIHRNISTPISRTEMSRILQISSKYLTTCFEEVYDCNFVKTNSALRLETARMYLTQNPKRIDELYKEVGFNSVNHFIYSFRGYFGITPYQFTKKLRKLEQMTAKQKRQLFSIVDFPEISKSPTTGNAAASCSFKALSGIICITNLCDCQLAIYWMDFEGNKLFMQHIDSRDFFRYHTGVGHCFVFEKENGNSITVKVEERKSTCTICDEEFFSE